MPKSGKQKYYAVKVGRGGPQVYTTWEKVRWRLTGRISVGVMRCARTLTPFQCFEQVIFRNGYVRDTWMLKYPKKVQRYPGNKYKSFYSLAEAQEWINPPDPSASPHLSRV